MPIAPQESPRRQPPEVRRAQILEAAERCLGRSGYHGTTMDDVVRESGLSKGSLYWHFSSKEDLLLALFERYEEEFYRAWGPEGRVAESVQETVMAGVPLLFEMGARAGELMPVWLGFLEQPRARRRLADLYARSREALAALIERGIDRGELAPISATAIAAGITGLAEGLFLQAVVDPGFDARAPCLASLEAMLEGIRA